MAVYTCHFVKGTVDGSTVLIYRVHSSPLSMVCWCLAVQINLLIPSITWLLESSSFSFGFLLRKITGRRGGGGGWAERKQIFKQNLHQRPGAASPRSETVRDQLVDSIQSRSSQNICRGSLNFCAWMQRLNFRQSPSSVRHELKTKKIKIKFVIISDVGQRKMFWIWLTLDHFFICGVLTDWCFASCPAFC